MKKITHMEIHSDGLATIYLVVRRCEPGFNSLLYGEASIYEVLPIGGPRYNRIMRLFRAWVEGESSGACTTHKFFTAAPGKTAGDNWLIAHTGTGDSGEEWYVTTYYLHGTDALEVTRGAQGDAELIATLLNMYYSGKIKIESRGTQ